MDQIREEKLMHYRRIEDIIQNIEKTEAEANASIRRRLETHRTNIGPANDLIRFLYILEQQYQNDSEEIKNQTRENVLDYLYQFQSNGDVVEEDENEDDENCNEPQEVTPPLPIHPQAPTTISQPLVTITTPQPPPPSTFVPPPTQASPPKTVLTPVQPPPVVVSSSAQLPPSSGEPRSSRLPPVTDLTHIQPKTLERYTKLLAEADQYRKRYESVDSQRKKRLTARIREIMNLLRKDTFDMLTKDLFAFLKGEKQTTAGQSIQVLNDDERLLCLSLLSALFFRQLLGGDLNENRTAHFVPLIGVLSENPDNKEFITIFLDRLHDTCPYTVPYYPKREPQMTDEEYFKAMRYTEIPEGNQKRWQTETEYLNRMSGLIRLFCKLLVRRGPPFDNALSYAWTWLADLLNLPPRQHITALIIRIFLDEAGEDMLKAYAKHFVNLVQAIEKQLLPELEKITSGDQIARLKLSLDNLKTKF